MNAHRTTCAYCGVGCGVLIAADGSVSGDPQHPANLGRLCVKGSALGETLGLQGRLLAPEIDGQPVNWEQALSYVARGLREVIDQYGPQAVAFYGSGQLLTEDYYVANKLMKGFIGAGNMDTNSRLCMASAVVGYKRAFGADAVPCSYEDIELADCVILIGSNTAWAHPVVYQRLVKARQQRPQMQVIVVDPRQTATCDIADMHLPLKPSSDAALFCGLLNWLVQQGYADNAFLDQHTQGAAETLAAAAQWSLEQVSTETGLSIEQLLAFFSTVAKSPRLLSLYSMGINQSSSGVDKCNAIINIHLATGRLGKPGCGPFSITGQPNAMGGREVGGLANQLAAHMGFTSADIATVSRFWKSDNVTKSAGHNAVDLFRALENNEIKAVWIFGTNPLVSLPDADRVSAALSRCRLVIVSDIMRDTDTTRRATVLLPALGWGEKNGTVTNSERCISRQRGFLPAPGDARPDWWIISQVAQRLGFTDAFNYSHPAQIFREHAALSGFENHGSRAFDISGLATLSDEQWDHLAPIQWPINAANPQGTPRLFTSHHYYHPGGKARLIPITPRPAQSRVSASYPLVMNTGRIRDQWHTMTRTGKASKLMQHISEPFCQFHPDDAPDIHAGDLLRVESTHGWALLRAQPDQQQQRGSVFVPMHWNGIYSAQARVSALVAAHVDPLSGQPESKFTPVRLRRWHMKWQGELFTRIEQAHGIPEVAYWSRITQQDVAHLVLADTSAPEDWLAWLSETVPMQEWQLQQAELGKGGFHLLAWRDGELQLAFYAGQQPMPDRSVVVKAFSQPPQSAAERLALLAGQAHGQGMSQGAIICSCYGIGEHAIHEAILDGCDNTQKLGARLKCGTNCGCCLPELKKLIQQKLPVLRVE